MGQLFTSGKKQIAHIKRLLECYRGDQDFRRLLHQNPEMSKELMRSRGVQLDPQEVSALWEKEPPSYQLREELRDNRLFNLWLEAAEWKEKISTSFSHYINASISSNRFNAWHSRQMARCKTELGKRSEPLIHCVIMFELTKGCSQECWFCGLDAKKLQDIFEYTLQNQALWCEVLTICKEEIGSACMHGGCYWATEPMDNPDYLFFVKDYQRISGWAPVTTTAMAAENLDRTRELLAYYSREYPMGCRFSITRLDDLHKIHQAFSAEELSHVPLLLQNKGSIIPKVSCGKLRNRNYTKNDSLQEKVFVPGTIACLSGFLVNMIDRSIKLISPCLASDRWPLGYRTFWEGAFSNGEEFRTRIRQAIEEVMFNSFPSSQTVSFRRDLAYESLEDGFRLTSNYWKGSFRSNNAYKTIGLLLNRKESTIAQIVSTATRKGVNLFNVIAQLNLLFEQGFLEDDFREQ